MTVKATITRRTSDLEAAILAAARDVLAQRGLDGLSMRAVAERVGVSATALYHYFENKDALVERVVQSGFLRFGEYLQEAAERHPHGSLERVRALGEAYVHFALENQAYFRVLFSLRPGHPQKIGDLPDGGGYGLLRAAVVDSMAAGTMRRTDPDLVVMYLWSMTHGLVTIAMACRIEECPELGPGITGRQPLDLFKAFGTFVRDGLAQRSDEGATANTGEGSA
jgi:AcrR family transcriptional regulator